MGIPRIILRNKDFKKAEISSKFTYLTSELEFSNLAELVREVGLEKIMTDVLDERINDDVLENSQLYSKFIEAEKSSNENDWFIFAYKIRDDMAVRLDEHIYIYHLDNSLSINGEKLLPWYYADSKIYIADTWWETDEDILDDLCNLSFVQFIVKYKGY